MTSFYWWEGKVQEEGECLLILKVARANERAAIARIKELHSYAVPCVNAFRVAAGNPDYLAWVAREAPPARRGARTRATAKAGRTRRRGGKSEG